MFSVSTDLHSKLIISTHHKKSACLLCNLEVSNIEGSVHRGSISIYFWFWDFYTIRQISTSPTSLWRHFFLISQHRKSYKPSENGAICASAYLLCAQRFYRSAVFDRAFVQTLIALCVADRSGTKVLCANFVANSILQRAQMFYQAR